MDKQYWEDLAKDYQAAAQRVFGHTLSPNAMLLAMAVAEHETLNGRAWPGTFNFGAVQLRSLTKDEQARFDAGAIKQGDTFPGNPGGVLHVDTHPPAIKYAVWFAAFPTRVDGIAYFLKVLWGRSGNAPEQPGATAETVAKAMYLHGYYEGWHKGARPYWKRVGELTPPEAANVADYAGAVGKCADAIRPHLTVPVEAVTFAPVVEEAVAEAVAEKSGNVAAMASTTIAAGTMLAAVIAYLARC